MLDDLVVMTINLTSNMIFSGRICEICGATAQNVASQQINEPSNGVAAAVASSAPTAPLTLVETRTIFHGRRIMNFLLACMLLAFAMSWLFHFKLMSQDLGRSPTPTGGRKLMKNENLGSLGFCIYIYTFVLLILMRLVSLGISELQCGESIGLNKYKYISLNLCCSKYVFFF